MVSGADDDTETVEFVTSFVDLGDIAVMNNAIRQGLTVGIEGRRLRWKVYRSSDDRSRIYQAIMF